MSVCIDCMAFLPVIGNLCQTCFDKRQKTTAVLADRTVLQLKNGSGKQDQSQAKPGSKKQSLTKEGFNAGKNGKPQTGKKADAKADPTTGKDTTSRGRGNSRSTAGGARRTTPPRDNNGSKRQNQDSDEDLAVKKPPKKSKKAKHTAATPQWVKKATWTRKEWSERFGDGNVPNYFCPPAFLSQPYADLIQAAWDRSATGQGSVKKEFVPTTDPMTILDYNRRVTWNESRGPKLVGFIGVKMTTKVVFEVSKWDAKMAQEHLAAAAADGGRCSWETATLASQGEYGTIADVLAHLRLLQFDLTHYTKQKHFYIQSAYIGRSHSIEHAAAFMRSNPEMAAKADFVTQQMVKARENLASAHHLFITGCEQVGHDLLQAIRDTCLESGVYHPDTGQKVSTHRVEDPKTLSIIFQDTEVAIKTLHILNIIMIKRMAWFQAECEKEISTVIIDPTELLTYINDFAGPIVTFNNQPPRFPRLPAIDYPDPFVVEDIDLGEAQ